MRKVLMILLFVVALSDLEAISIPGSKERIASGLTLNDFLRENPEIKDVTTTWLGKESDRVSGGIFERSGDGNPYFDREIFIFENGTLKGMMFSGERSENDALKANYVEALLSIYGAPAKIGIFDAPQRDSIGLFWNRNEGRIYGVIPFKAPFRFALQFSSAEVSGLLDPKSEKVLLSEPNAGSDAEFKNIQEVTQLVRSHERKSVPAPTIEPTSPKSSSSAVEAASAPPTPEVKSPHVEFPSALPWLIGATIIAAIIIGLVVMLRKS